MTPEAEARHLHDLFDIRHTIGEPCGEWMGDAVEHLAGSSSTYYRGVYICGCNQPTVGPNGKCVRCHHGVKAVPKEAMR